MEIPTYILVLLQIVSGLIVIAIIEPVIRHWALNKEARHTFRTTGFMLGFSISGVLAQWAHGDIRSHKELAILFILFVAFVATMIGYIKKQQKK